MRSLIACTLALWASFLYAAPEVIANETDTEAPKVDLVLKPEPPLMQSYYTELGQQATLVTPNVGEPYSVVPYDYSPIIDKDNSESNVDTQWQLLQW